MQVKTFLPYLSILALCVLCALHIRPLVVDDGFIAHRYAANIVHGRGVVFTVGQRVEGISDIGWTLLMVIPQLLHWRPELFAVCVGFLCASLSFVIAYRTAVRHFQIPPYTALVVIGGTIINAEFWLVALNGIESGLYSLALIASFSLLVRNRLFWAGLGLGFATTLRPESVVLAPLALGSIALYRLFTERGRAKAAWEAAIEFRYLLLPWALIVCAVVGWRLAYFGEWLPNTVFAKSHPIHFLDLLRAIKYILLFAIAAMPWIIFSVIAFVRRLDFALAIALSWLAYEVAIVIASGGDWMPGHRFLTVFLPIVSLASACGFEYVLRTVRLPSFAVIGGSAAILLAVQFQNIFWTATKGLLNHHNLADIIGTYYEPPFIELATVLKPVLQPDDVVSPEVLGIFSYMLLDTPVHDWLGLADAHVAHHGTVYYPPYGKADPAYSVDVVAPSLFAFSSGERNLEVFQSQTGGRFGQRYSFWQLVGQPLILALRRDREAAFLNTIRQSTLQIVPLSAGSLK